MVKTIMFMGTGSDVGKSILVTGLCRVLKRQGVSVAPFKPQNMALNSFITVDGGEMGRAQVAQAEAAGVVPHVDMNPVLLKPTTDVGAQVILQGKVHSNMKARDYHNFKPRAREVVFDSFDKLSSRYDVVVVEGAGSPAEINLREGDIANMGFALEALCPVMLVGDINKGGVFASFVGTLELIDPTEAALVRGLIVNKFRGDATLLEPAYEEITRRTGKPFMGTVPYFRDIFIQEEDGLHLEEMEKGAKGARVRVAVIVAGRMSNFTDFDPFIGEEGVRLDYVQPGERLGEADIVILPGSKNTIDDLKKLKDGGLGTDIVSNHRRGATIVGVCGGFQMLGRSVVDPHGVESLESAAEGLGLLNCETVMAVSKVTAQANGSVDHEWLGGVEEVEGYEIHMGRTKLGDGVSPFARLKRLGEDGSHDDGAVSGDGRVIGTYLHGIFDNDAFRKKLLDRYRGETGGTESFRAKKERGYEQLADLFEECLDVEGIKRIIEEGA